MDFLGLFNSKIFNWLSSIEKTCFDLQKTAAKQLTNPKFQAEKTALLTIMSECSRLRADMDREKKNTKLISKSPPGFLSAIVDMLHSILVNPSAPSEKQKFYEKIDGLVERQQKSYRFVNNELGISGDQIQSIVRDLFTEDTFSKQELPYLQEETLSFFESLLDGSSFKSKKAKLSSQVSSILNRIPVNLRSTYIKLLPNVLKAVRTLTPKENLDYLQKKNEELNNIVGNLQVKKASIEDLKSFIEKFEDLQKKQGDLLKEIEVAFSKASKGLLLGPSRQKFNLEEKKYNYLRTLIESTEKKLLVITELLSRLKQVDLAKNLNKDLSKEENSTSSSSSTNTDDAKNQKENKSSPSSNSTSNSNSSTNTEPQSSSSEVGSGAAPSKYKVKSFKKNLL